jgi:hypothetical protein
MPAFRVIVAVLLCFCVAVGIYDVLENRSREEALLQWRLQGRDQLYSAMAADYQGIIDGGSPGAEGLLVDVLRERGSPQMCEDFLNSGNSALFTAALDWARSNNYTVTPGSGSTGGYAVAPSESVPGQKTSGDFQ